MNQRDWQQSNGFWLRYISRPERLAVAQWNRTDDSLMVSIRFSRKEICFREPGMFISVGNWFRAFWSRLIDRRLVRFERNSVDRSSLPTSEIDWRLLLFVSNAWRSMEANCVRSRTSVVSEDTEWKSSGFNVISGLFESTMVCNVEQFSKDLGNKADFSCVFSNRSRTRWAAERAGMLANGLSDRSSSLSAVILLIISRSASTRIQTGKWQSTKGSALTWVEC